MSKQLSKKHHFVPRFYFKHWFPQPNSGFYLHIKAPDGMITSSVRYPRSIAVEDNLYTIFADGLFHGRPFSDDENDSVEQYLSTVERKASAAYRVILAQGVNALNVLQRNDWAKFINSLMFRRPRFLDRKVEVVRNGFASWKKDVLEKLGDRTLHREILNRIDPENLSKNHVLSKMVDAIEDAENIEYLCNLSWCVIQLKDGALDTFLTSETPLIVNHGTKLEPPLFYSLALSPTRLFAAMPLDLTKNEEFVARFTASHNLLLMQQSQYLVSDKPISDDGCVKNLKAASLYLPKRQLRATPEG